MKIGNRILVALVLVLAAAVVFLYWKVYHSEDRSVYQPPPPPPVRADDSPEIRAQLDRLRQAQEQFAKAQAARDQRLEAALAEARKNPGGAADAARWQKALDDHREQWAKYQRENEAWRQEIEQRAESTSPGADLPQPPSPPFPEGPEPGDDSNSPQANQEFEALAGIVAATICIAEPPLCIVAGLLKGLLGEGREEFVRLAKAVALGEGVDPAVVDAAGKLMMNDPKAREAFLKILAEKAKTGVEDSPELADIKQQLAPVFEQTSAPDARTVIGILIDLLGEGGSCEEILASLPDPERLTDEQKQELELRLAAGPAQDYIRLWKGCLEPHYATGALAEAQP